MERGWQLWRDDQDREEVGTAIRKAMPEQGRKAGEHGAENEAAAAAANEIVKFKQALGLFVFAYQ